MSKRTVEAGFEKTRLDLWLHHARFFRTRTTASQAVAAGGIRLNGQPCRKPAQSVRPGDRITLSAHGRVRVLQVAALADRRGPATEAHQLYTEIDS